MGVSYFGWVHTGNSGGMLFCSACPVGVEWV